TNAYYVRVQYTIGSTQTGEPQINRGSTLLPYHTFYQRIKNKHISVDEEALSEKSVTTGKIKNGSVTPVKTSIFKVSTNLFDKSNALLSKGIDGATGAIVDNPSNFVSQPISVNEEESYTADGNSFRVAFYDSFDRFISTIVSPS